MDSTQLPDGTADSTDERSQDHLRANPPSRYHITLEEDAKSYPFITNALMRSDRHRLRRWKQFIDPVDRRAMELLLNFLGHAMKLLEEDDKTSDLAFIPKRIEDDIRMSLEGLLSGYLQVASDAMRDIIEVELLVRDFTLDLERIIRWRNASENVLRNNFSAGNMRKRQANALGIDVSEVPGATDYGAHSRLLHLGPPLLFERSPESGHQLIYVLNSLHDIMFHGLSVTQALASFLDTISRPISTLHETLAALKSSLDDLDRARAAIEALGRRAEESLSASNVVIFENGLLVAVTQDSSRADFFSINRLDFRRFHRDVSARKSAAFDLTPLGSSETRSGGVQVRKQP